MYPFDDPFEYESNHPFLTDDQKKDLDGAKRGSSKLKQELNQLGTTVEEVAQSLRNRGIKGDCTCWHNPIAEYLISLGYRMPTVTHAHIAVNGLWDDDTAASKTPETIANFLLRLDKIWLTDPT